MEVQIKLPSPIILLLPNSWTHEIPICLTHEPPSSPFLSNSSSSPSPELPSFSLSLTFFLSFSRPFSLSLFQVLSLSLSLALSLSLSLPSLSLSLSLSLSPLSFSLSLLSHCFCQDTPYCVRVCLVQGVACGCRVGIWGVISRCHVHLLKLLFLSGFTFQYRGWWCAIARVM